MTVHACIVGGVPTFGTRHLVVYYQKKTIPLSRCLIGGRTRSSTQLTLIARQCGEILVGPSMRTDLEAITIGVLEIARHAVVINATP